MSSSPSHPTGAPDNDVTQNQLTLSSGAYPGVYLTSAIAGLGGRIKERPTDFLVDEVPLYQPSGEGEHLYMLVQKTSLTTPQAAEILARHFRVSIEAIGFAGLKDTHAVTRQVFSVHIPGKAVGDFPSLQDPALAILWLDQHQAKLRRGHLEGNRFSIRIRGVEPSGVIRASAVLNALATKGVPNRFGPQRFGILDNNHRVGACLIRGDYHGACDVLLGPDARWPNVNTRGRAFYAASEYQAARDAFPHAARNEQRVLNKLANGAMHKNAILSLDDQILGLYLSAFQSAVFNATLERRLADETFDRCIEGDIAMKRESGATFVVTAEVAQDPATMQRAERFEITPTGPMWGLKMRSASGSVDIMEKEVLAATGITMQDITQMPRPLARLMNGERRALRLALRDPQCEGGVDEFGPYVRCAFELAAGGYATVAIDEVMKSPAPVLRTDDRRMSEQPQQPEQPEESAPGTQSTSDADLSLDDEQVR